MTTLREAAQQALEALEQYAPQHGNPDDMDAAITALRAALAQPQPVQVDEGARMTTLREAAWQMLEALDSDNPDVQLRAAIALRAALAQQEQEPVAWRYQNSNTDHVYLVWKKGTGGRNWNPLYTHPPRREWQSLTEEEINDGRDQLPTEDLCGWSFRQGVYFAESKLKEKNNG